MKSVVNENGSLLNGYSMKWIGNEIIEMKGITRCKLTIISESAVCKKFLGQIWSNAASL